VVIELNRRGTPRTEESHTLHCLQENAMTTTTTRPTTPATPAPRAWHRHFDTLLVGVVAAVLGSAVWAGLNYLAAHLSLHWR
jgi:hypothetical protein